MYNRLYNFLADHNIISKKQYGFRENYSTYIILAGYPASLGTLPLSPPSLGLPGFEQNISSVIAQNNSIPEIRFKH